MGMRNSLGLKHLGAFSGGKKFAALREAKETAMKTNLGHILNITFHRGAGSYHHLKTHSLD